MPIKHLSTGSTNPPLQNGKLRLYSMRFCPYAHRVHLVLAAKKVPYDIVYINLVKKPEWYLEKFPLGKVPALLVDGEELYESLVISDFLDEKYQTRPLYPKDPLQKAKDRLLIEKFGKVIAPYYKVALAPIPDPLMFEELYLAFDEFERELVRRGTPFYGGAQPGMVDYMIWPWSERLEVVRIINSDQFRFPKERFLRLGEWTKAMVDDEAVKSFYLEPEIHAKFLIGHRAGTPDYDNTIP